MKDKASFFVNGFTQVAILTFLSRISGFFRDIFIAAFLGTGIFSDIFLIAFKLPNLFRKITGEGALTSALLPLYSKLKEEKGNFFAYNFFKIISKKIVIILLLLTAILEIIMPLIPYIIAPGFINNSTVLEQITLLTRITILFMPLVSLVALLGIITNVSGKFWVFSSTPIILNFSLILSCFFIDDFWTIKSFPLALGTVIGGVLQIIFVTLIIKSLRVLKHIDNLNKKLSLDEKEEINVHIKHIWKKFLPAAFGSGILQINILMDTILASLLGFGAVSYLYFADRIAQLPLGIIGVALGTTLLTSLSKLNATKDLKQFSNELIISIKIGLFFSIPSFIVLVNFSDLFIKVLFERGEFNAFSTTQTSHALIAYAYGIPAFVMLKSCQPAFLAKGDTKTPMYLSLILLIINLTLSIILMSFFGHMGIALATSLASIVGVIIYITLLVKNEKILKLEFSFKNNNMNIFGIIKYAFSIILVSLCMLFFMEIIIYILNFYKFDNILISLVIIISGMSMYLLTTYSFGYIPQELLKMKLFKFLER